jgi:hypothetical protein
MINGKFLALVTMLIAISGVSFFVYKSSSNRIRTAALTSVTGHGALPFTEATQTWRSASPAISRVNPYAVVRGGICARSNVPDQEEASRKKWESLLRDPFWQSIFLGVKPEEFHLIKTSFPLHDYVTYWKMENGQLIHWTGRQILIPAGTRVFSMIYICACGNQLAAVLPSKSSATVLPPQQEPPLAYLVPPDPEPLSTASQRLSGQPLVPLQERAMPPYNNRAESIPPAPPMPFGSFSPPGGGAEPEPPIIWYPPPPKTVAMPEGGAPILYLLLGGLVCFAAIWQNYH